MNETELYLSTLDVSEMLRVPGKLLKLWRTYGCGPQCVKKDDEIKYLFEDVKNFAREYRKNPAAFSEKNVIATRIRLTTAEQAAAMESHANWIKYEFRPKCKKWSWETIQKERRQKWEEDYDEVTIYERVYLDPEADDLHPTEPMY